MLGWLIVASVMSLAGAADACGRLARSVLSGPAPVACCFHLRTTSEPSPANTHSDISFHSLALHQNSLKSRGKTLSIYAHAPHDIPGNKQTPGFNIVIPPPHQDLTYRQVKMSQRHALSDDQVCNYPEAPGLVYSACVNDSLWTRSRVSSAR